MATPITKLLPEIQLRINSDPDRYDPNANGVIDDGDELSTLLSEYKVNSEEDLMNSFWGFDRKTVEEREEMKTRKFDYYANTLTKGLWTGAEVLGGIFTAIGLLVYPPVGLIAGGITLASHLIHDEVAEDDAYDAIKAEQAKKAEEHRDYKRKHEAEMKAQQEAMDQKALEYQQNMDKATQNINVAVTSAQKRAKQLNDELKEAQTSLTENQVKQDSLQVK